MLWLQIYTYIFLCILKVFKSNQSSSALMSHVLPAPCPHMEMFCYFSDVDPLTCIKPSRQVHIIAISFQRARTRRAVCIYSSGADTGLWKHDIWLFFSESNGPQSPWGSKRLSCWTGSDHRPKRQCLLLLGSSLLDTN